MGKGIVSIDESLCMSCNSCVQACPFSYLKDTKIGPAPYKKAYPELKPDHRCTGCGICVTACPVGCMTIHA